MGAANCLSTSEGFMDVVRVRNKPFANGAAAAMLALMAVLMFTSAWDDTPTSDDNVSIASGYSYLRKAEYRLEPQNPPLIKDLSALPLLFMWLHEPWNQKGWGKALGDENDPDPLGREFLFNSGNNADAILYAAKAPLILLTVAFGGVLFWWTRKEFGSFVALLTIFLYTFSPTFLAHGRSITTDVGSTAGFFIGTIALLRFLKDPSWKNVVLAGLAMGFAFLTKFSTIALVPIALILAVLWVLVHAKPSPRSVFRRRKLSNGISVIVFRARPVSVVCGLLAHYVARTVCIIAIAYIVIYPVYLLHVWNYAPELQLAEARIHRVRYDLHGTARDLVLWASDKPVVRPWAEYFLGLLVALKASRWGQPLFFLGKVHANGLRLYFPMVYLIKEPLAMHVLTVLALLFALSRIRRPIFQRAWLAKHFTELAFLFVLGIYWAALIRSHMNIGVRHLLPAFPLTYVLVANQIALFYRSASERPIAAWVFRLVLGALLAWQAISVVRVYPAYLAYFNEIAGGPDGGWRYVNDSNLDWGQDFKRLSKFVEQRGISSIHADLFGPADPAYYLKQRYQGPVGCAQPPKGWVAVSAMIYAGAPWNPECDYRRWLPEDKLVTKIGYSIFVFHVE